MKQKSKSFQLYLIHQGILNLGDAFHFIAITSQLISVTGSGIYASFTIILTPISSFLFSPIAGILGDRLNEKYLILFLMILKSAMALLFASSSNIINIYILILLLAIIEIISNPLRKKILVNLLKPQDILMANSIISGIAGFMFIIGPILAGFLIEKYGVALVFSVNSLLYFLSGIILFFIRVKSQKSLREKKNIIRGNREALNYLRKNPHIKKLILISTILSLNIASINIAFYPFVFDILKIKDKTWGTMMSIFYGSSLFAMYLSINLNAIIKRLDLFFLYFSLIFISLCWLSYGFLEYIPLIMAIQFMEGILTSLFTMVLNSKIQTLTNKDYLARIVAINDIFVNFGKLISAIISYSLLIFLPVQNLFILNFIILFFYGLYLLSPKII